MVKVKPLFNNGHEEMMMMRNDIIILLQNLETPEDLNHREQLIEVIERICKDFTIDYADYVNAQLEEEITHKKYWDAIEAQYM